MTIKKIRLPGVFLLFIFMLVCCSPDKNILPKNIYLLVGNWQLENSSTFERWENNNTYLSGEVISIENTDTLVVEKLRIFRDKNSIYYEATVPSQNNGAPIRFKLTRQNGNEFQFENPDHDFPQKIMYNFKNKNELKATISGENKQASFNYRKIN